MGTDIDTTDSTDDGFDELVGCAREIVLPAVMTVPRQRTRSWYDVSNECLVLTDGMASYGA